MSLRIGTEDKKKTIAAAVLGVILLAALVWFYRQEFGDSTPPAPQPAAVTTSAPPVATAATRAASTAAGAHEAIKVSANLDPTLHPEWMRQAETLAYTGKGRNIFSAQSAPIAIPKPIAAVRPGPVIPQGPPPPPPPPLIDLKFFGYSATKAGLKKVFLLHGDDVFIAAEGDVVDRRYRIVRIQPTSVQVEDIPYKNTQNLPLIQN